MNVRDHPRPHRAKTRSVRAISLGLTIMAHLAAWNFAPPARASAADPWAVETDARSDKLLIKQRFAKLKRHPFDKKQWRALERSLGEAALIKRIERAADSTPNNLNLHILRALAAMAKEDYVGAARLLARFEGKDASQVSRATEARIFDLRVEALDRSHAWKDAIALLEDRAGSAPHSDRADTRSVLLARAFRIADRAALDQESLRIAQALAASAPEDLEAQLRLARAATKLNRPKTTDLAFAAAIALADETRRYELIGQRASARVTMGDADGGGALLWELLKTPKRGRSHLREQWWRALEAAHRKSGTNDALVSKLGRWLDDPNHASETMAWATLARTQAAAGMDPVAAWQQALQRDPRDPETSTSLVAALEHRGDVEGALAQYRALTGRSAPEVQLGLEMASRIMTNGERQIGLEVANEIANNAGRSANTLLLLLDFYNTQAEPELALKIAKRLARARPRDPEARIALGEQLYEMGQRDEALQEWNKLPKIMRPRHQGWARHAQVLSAHANTNRGFRAQALASLDKAIHGSPDDPKYLRLRAALEEEQRTYDRAYRSWALTYQHAQGPTNQLIREEARTRMIELLAGTRLRDQSKYRGEMVATARERLLAGSTPDALEAGWLLAELYTREEQLLQATQIRAKLVEMFPGRGELLMQLASAQQRANQLQAAARTLERLVETDPSRSIDALTLLSEIAYVRGDLEGAQRAALRAASLGRGGSDALFNLGERYEESGAVAKAEAAYRAVLGATPKNPRAHLRLADLQLTAGDLSGAALSFRRLLDSGGPSDVMREAGKRALDLAEITGTLDETLALAVRRTRQAPDPDEARDFLLATLERSSTAEIEAWLVGDTRQRLPDRIRSLRLPLVSALSRGPIRARLRAAEHLGTLAFPDTAVPLARMGGNLAPPPDATIALRAFHRRTQIAAIRAAATLDDVRALPLLDGIVAPKNARPVDSTVRTAALWALAGSEHAESAESLRRQLSSPRQEIDTIIACIGLAKGLSDEHRASDASLVAAVARRTKKSEIRQACSFAAAALTPDHRVHKLLQRLRADDPTIAAIAAWRLGHIDPSTIDLSTVQDLFKSYLGPAGLPRDAAAAALARLLGASIDEAQDRRPVPMNPGETTRWLGEKVAPRFDPVAPEALGRFGAALAAAISEASAGTRPEIIAAERTRGPCPGDPPSDATPTSGDERCLAPLIRGTVRLHE